MHKIILLLLFFILMLSIAKAQSKEDKQIIKNLDDVIAEKFSSISPGCAVLVSKKGQVIYEKGFGKANIELNVSMRPEMVFRIGSITKQYTAVAILQLAEQGKILLEDSIQKFIKNFPYKGHTITIENLLTHTSGIKDYELLDAHIPNAIRIEFPAKQIIDSLANLPLDFIPGTKYSYSNSNYFLLGYIIEMVSGKSYKDYLQQNIFKPAGLSGTFYDSPTQIIPNRVNGYTKDSATYRNVDYISMSLVYSAGALLSNVEDLYKWHQALYAQKLLKKETLEKAFTSFILTDGQPAEYGYGWFIKNLEGNKTIGHGGAIDGFRSWEIYYPEDDVFVTALFNSDNDNYLPFFLSILNIVVNKKDDTNSAAVKVNNQLLKKYIGTYTCATLPGRQIIISLDKNVLNANIVGQGTWSIIFISETKFNIQGMTNTSCEFLNQPDEATKIIIQQNGEYVWQKINDTTNLIAGKSFQNNDKNITVSDSLLNSYAGTYRFLEDTTQLIKITKKDNRLYAELSNGSGNNMTLLAQTETLFYLPDVRRIATTIEFIIQNGKVTGIYWTQEKKHEGKKSE